jgi:hypothetical protein
MSEYSLVLDRIEKEHTVTPEDAVLHLPSTIAMILDYEGITEVAEAIDTAFASLGRAPADTRFGAVITLITDLIEEAYGRADLSNAERGLLREAIRSSAHHR